MSTDLFNIIMEAEAEANGPDETGTDYSQEAENNQPPEQDTNQDNNQNTTEPPADNPPDTAANDQAGAEDDNTQANDYSADAGELGDGNDDDFGGGNGGGNSTASSAPSDTPQDNTINPDGKSPEDIKTTNKKVEAYHLLEDFTNLYESLNLYIKKISNFSKDNLLYTVTRNQVIKNFNHLASVLYKYITYYFDTMSYEYNLYTYNYLVQCCKVNIDLLKKANETGLN